MEIVIAYYKNDEGGFERYEMFLIDYNEIDKKFKDRWSLEPPPTDDIKDMVPEKVNHVEQLAAQKPAAPPILERQTVPPSRRPTFERAKAHG